MRSVAKEMLALVIAVIALTVFPIGVVAGAIWTGLKAGYNWQNDYTDRWVGRKSGWI